MSKFEYNPFVNGADVESTHINSTGDEITSKGSSKGGITLLDHFATHAMNQFISTHEAGRHTVEYTMRIFVRISYDVAELMLQERQKRLTKLSETNNYPNENIKRNS